MSFSLNTDEDDRPIVANIAAPPIEEDILFYASSKVIVSDGELLEIVQDMIERVNDEKQKNLLDVYHHLQLKTGVCAFYEQGEVQKTKWVGITVKNQLVFSRGVQMLIYEGLDRALFNRMFYPFTYDGPKQPPPSYYYQEGDEFNISDEDRVNHVILKWREYCTNSTDFMIPLTKM